MLLFAAQVARTPAAIALVFGREELTYRQLDEKANQLARYLEGMGVGSEKLVGIFMDRSPAMIVALLAILKAGGAYVPIDPNYPSERIAFVIEDSRAAVVLTSESVRARLPAISARVVSLEDDSAAISSLPPDLVSCVATSADLAYVIYTSGSTGKPKGVMVEHRNVLSFFSSMDLIIGNEPGVWLALTSISFDISVLEILWTLTRGFKVVLHGDEGTHTIASELDRHGVTHIQLTPSLARMLVIDPGFLAALGSVKMLLLGGEALPASLLSALRRATSAELCNMYGPTETTVWSTAYRVPDATDFGSNVPIGRPLANTRAYVLDAEQRPLADGEPGELYLGGEGVVRGYWDQPELTAERFVADPITREGRLYRTGDLVRLQPDGNLEFLGRTDFQVKLRGHRIELGEIEAVLEQQPSVGQAVVVMREDRPADMRLIAFVVPTAGESAIPQTLRAALQSKLPEYMVPAQFVVLDRLPLTPNGKIDRRSLPKGLSQSEQGGPATGHDQVPQSEIERAIATIWAEALGVEQIGVDQNVFDLGATSLMMPEVQVALQRTLDREISLVDLFEFHTVSSLAAHLAGHSLEPAHTNRAQRRRAARNQYGRL